MFWVEEHQKKHQRKVNKATGQRLCQTHLCGPKNIENRLRIGQAIGVDLPMNHQAKMQRYPHMALMGILSLLTPLQPDMRMNNGQITHNSMTHPSLVQRFRDKSKCQGLHEIN